MKWLNDFIEKTGADKLLHLAVGGWIVAKFCEAGQIYGGLLGLLFLALISVLKERLMDDEADVMDIGFAMLGGFIEFGTYILLLWAYA